MFQLIFIRFKYNHKLFYIYNYISKIWKIFKIILHAIFTIKLGLNIIIKLYMIVYDNHILFLHISKIFKTILDAIFVQYFSLE